jgi:hypothetical protein
MIRKLIRADKGVDKIEEIDKHNKPNTPKPNSPIVD